MSCNEVFMMLSNCLQTLLKYDKHLLFFFQLVELKPGGSQIPVTESNKKEYLDLLAQYRLSSSVKQEIEAFAKGTAEICFLSVKFKLSSDQK